MSSFERSFTLFVQMSKPKNSLALTGYRLIARYAQALGTGPGVYQMQDASSRVLYVGKAYDLHRRVSSYAKEGGHSPRIARMISETAQMEFLTTHTETEALLLEQNLIKQLKPRYNVLLRDDKSFPNILVTKAHDFPQIKKHRGARREKGTYFGPFASASAVNHTLNQLQKVFLLRNCSESVFNARTRPCLLYQIKRCSGPCVGKISKQAYAELVSDAELFLRGRSTKIQAKLAHEMAAASAALEFERASILRDRINALTKVQQAQGINPRGLKEADILALHRSGDQACVQIFFVRGGQSWGSHAYYPRTGVGAEEAEILQAFVTQFYDTKPPPPKLLLSHPLEDPELVEEILSQKAEKRVEIIVPQRGERAVLMANALRNACENLSRRLSENTVQRKLLAGLAEAFQIPAVPTRIEVYDNSHIQGSHAVGAMIVSGPDGFEKKQYRTFTIKDTDLTPGDDFAMMREVLTRRFTRLMKEDPKRAAGIWPDLLLIDGGIGQSNAAAEVLETLGIKGIFVVGVAKGVDRNAGREVFYVPQKRPFALPSKDPVLYFIQRLRDEAHRFAIGTHRARRKSAMFKNPLDEIPGIGATRKKALLAHFGSAKAVSRSGLVDLKAVKGISGSMAEVIYDFFHEHR